MESLIDHLSSDKWQEISSDSRGEGYKEFWVNRNHKRIDNTTISFMVSDDDGNRMTVILSGTKDGKDPLSGIGRCELKVDGLKNVTGLDLDGDCVVCK